MNYRELTKPYFKSLLKDIKYFCRIKSFNDPKTATNKMPYGKGVDEALTAFANFGKKHGFKVERDNEYVELSLGTKGPIYGIYGHLDVVKIASGRYDAVLKKDRLLGRGVSDDKGPLLAAVYAVIALREKGLLKNVRIKIMAGGGEELGSHCLKKYAKTHPAPKYGFTPDSHFPVTYGEKGLLSLYLEKKIKFKNIKSIVAGKANNVVIGGATFEVTNINEVKGKLKTKHTINGNKVTFYGKSVHCSTPQLGKNAFLYGLLELAKLNNDPLQERIASYFFDNNGKKIECYYQGELGEITYCIGLVKYQNERLKFCLAIRYPENVNPSQLSKRIAKITGFKVTKAEYAHYLLYNKHSRLVNILLNAYQKEWHDYEAQPFVTGGGTYAKYIKNTLAFGPVPAGSDNREHSEEEFFKIDELKKTLATYARALDSFIHNNEN